MRRWSTIIIVLRTIELHKMLARKNMTLAEFAKRLETTQYYLAEMMSHKKNPSPQMRKRITRALGRGAKWDILFEIKERIHETQESATSI